jgi:hypothetical protein
MNRVMKLNFNEGVGLECGWLNRFLEAKQSNRENFDQAINVWEHVLLWKSWNMKIWTEPSNMMDIVTLEASFWRRKRPDFNWKFEFSQELRQIRISELNERPSNIWELDQEKGDFYTQRIEYSIDYS